MVSEAEGDADDVFDGEHLRELDDEDAAVDGIAEERIGLRRAGGDVVETGVDGARLRRHIDDVASAAAVTPVSETKFREAAQKRPTSRAVSDTKPLRSV